MQSPVLLTSCPGDFLSCRNSRGEQLSWSSGFQGCSDPCWQETGQNKWKLQLGRGSLRKEGLYWAYFSQILLLLFGESHSIAQTGFELSLCRWGWPWAHRDPPTSLSWVQLLCLTHHTWLQYFYISYMFFIFTPRFSVLSGPALPGSLLPLSNSLPIFMSWVLVFCVFGA